MVADLSGQGLLSHRSPDISLEDFFLWGLIKGLIFQNNLHAFPEVKANIVQIISGIRRGMIQSAAQSMKA